MKLLEQFGVLLHLDVMDGRVWPSITAEGAGPRRAAHSLLKDVHLLIEEPEKHVAAFAKAGADVISFSIEHCGDVAATLDLIGQQTNANDPARGIVRGVSLDPATPVDAIAAVADKIDRGDAARRRPDDRQAELHRRRCPRRSPPFGR